MSFQPKRATSEKAASSFGGDISPDAPYSDDSSSYPHERRRRDSFEKPQESSQDDDDALGDDITVTKGGWICRVERFEKHVDSRGRVHLRRPPKDTTLPFPNQDLSSSQEPQNLQEHKRKKKVQQSIISYVYNTTKARSSGLVEREAWITIKSPLILEVLREIANHDPEVRPHNTYCSQHRTYH